MGWLFCEDSREALIANIKYSLRRWTGAEVRPDEVSVVGNTLYALVRLEKPDTDGTTRFIAVFIMQGMRRCRNKYSHNSWGYKDMEESMGPNVADCPQYLLKLSDCPRESAVAWRNRCMAGHAAKKELRKKTNALVPGVYVFTHIPENQKEWFKTHGTTLRLDAAGVWNVPVGLGWIGVKAPKSWAVKFNPVLEKDHVAGSTQV